MSPYLKVKIIRAKEFHERLKETYEVAQQVVQQREHKLLCRRMGLTPKTRESQEVMNEEPIKLKEELSRKTIRYKEELSEESR